MALKNQLYNRTCKEFIRTNLLKLCRGRFSLVEPFCLFVLVIATHSIGHPTHSSLVFPTHSLQIHCVGLFGPKSILWAKGLKYGPYNIYIYIYIYDLEFSWFYTIRFLHPIIHLPQKLKNT